MAPRAGKDKNKGGLTVIGGRDAPASLPPTDGGHDHNKPSPADQEGLYLRHLHTIRGIERQIEDIQSGLKALKKRAAQAYSLCKSETSIPTEITKRRLKNEKLQRGDLDLFEKQWVWTGEVMGQPVYREPPRDLFEIEPERPDEWWFESGRAACLANKEADPVKAAVPPEKHQIWLKGHLAQQEKIAWAMAEKGVNPERAPGATGTGPTADEIRRETPECATCADDGTGLAPDVFKCPDCGAEYEAD